VQRVAVQANRLPATMLAFAAHPTVRKAMAEARGAVQLLLHDSLEMQVGALMRLH